MLAAKDQYINEASKSIFQLSADEQIRKRCLDREEYYLDLKAYERVIAEKDALFMKTVAEKDSALLQKDNEIEHLCSLLKEHGISH